MDTDGNEINNALEYITDMVYMWKFHRDDINTTKSILDETITHLKILENINSKHENIIKLKNKFNDKIDDTKKHIDHYKEREYTFMKRIVDFTKECIPVDLQIKRELVLITDNKDSHISTANFLQRNNKIKK